MSLSSNRLLFVFVALAASLAGHAWLLAKSKEKPPGSRILERWGHELRDQDDYEGAAAAYRLAIRRGQNSKSQANLEAHLGLALLQAGDEAAAYAHLLRAKAGGATESLYDLTLRTMAYDVDESGPFPRFAATHLSAKEKSVTRKTHPASRDASKEASQQRRTLLAKHESERIEEQQNEDLPVQERSELEASESEGSEKESSELDEEPASTRRQSGMSSKQPGGSEEGEGEVEVEERDAADEEEDDDGDENDSEEIGEVHDGDCDVPVTRRGKRGTFLANVSLNGSAATLIVDTGASLTVVGRDFADAIGLEVLDDKKLRAQTAAGQVLFDLARIDEVEIGGRSVHDVVVAICDDCATEHMDGLLGLDVQVPLHLTLDVANERLRFGDCEP
ncbi:MAG: clan AA aspartic protease [Deltaproteobacteria bacterium]|nr:clan AA aspartic protease [Deltaproteobacteria bacterium]